MNRYYIKAYDATRNDFNGGQWCGMYVNGLFSVMLAVWKLWHCGYAYRSFNIKRDV